MQHERKGVKRPLPCRSPNAPPPASSTRLAPTCGSPPPQLSRCTVSRSGSNSGTTNNTSRSPSARLRPRSNRRRDAPEGRLPRRFRPDQCCRCRPRNGAVSSLRLAGVVGIQVLGFLACPCRGFLPPGLSTGAALLPDVQTRTAAGDFESHASIRDTGDGGGGGGSSKGGSGSNGGHGSLAAVGLSFLAARGAGARGREGRRRSRGCRRSGGGFGGGDGGGSGGADVRGASPSRATRLPSAEEGPSLGLLYDRALLESDVIQGADATKRNAKGDSFRNGGGSRVSPANGSGGGGEGGDGDGKVGLAFGTAMESSGAGEEGGVPAAPAAITAAAAAAATVVEIDREEPPDLRVENNIAQNSTTQWTGVVNGEAAIAGSRGAGQEAGVAEALSPEDDARRGSPAARGRKWSGKGWLDSRAEEQSRKGPQERRGGESAAATDDAATVASTADGDAAASTPAAAAVAAVATADGAAEAVVAAAATAAADDAAATGAEPALAADAAGRAPTEQEPATQAVVGMDVCATAREELTSYLLDTGAPQSLVAAATTALFAAEPRCTLTEGTWKRWRQNLDGLRSTGFTGSDVTNMLALCPQLLALDFEGQVVPTMELLRKQLGMRPTDVRRVIRKAPEVLAPRADGSTAAETVDVLRALGLQTRHLRIEALRWPQLLAVPPGSFFQLAAFLASEEVGIKATNIGSLIRQAPWLVLQPIDAQMLPVVRFLRIAGVMDVERVVRAYPKVLCATIKGELAPRVRFLWSDVGVSEEDLPRVLQTFPLLFALPLTRMQDVMDFLSEDLTINEKDIAKIIRAFPSLLGLERERHMDGVVRYLKQLGVQNVGRFVSRLPPVLGYDVDTNLVPKMDYLVSRMGLSVYDVLTFPAYFSYPLETVIEPRTEFLSIRGRPITLVGLNIALQQGDADFARKVAKVQPRVYREFKEAYVENREAVRSGRRDAESLLSEPQRKAIGNLGGQSTSNNVSVTARATGVPANRQPQLRKPPQQQQRMQQQQEQQQQRQQRLKSPEKGSQVD